MDIDDAILSRCSAVVRFELPEIEDAKAIWRLQASLLKVKLSDEEIKRAVSHFNYSGRSIRQLLRLTARLCRKNKTDVTFENMKAASKFIAFSRKEGIRGK